MSQGLAKQAKTLTDKHKGLAIVPTLPGQPQPLYQCPGGFR
jgi:hypothetical protein